MMGIKELENQNSSKGNFSNDVVFRNGLLFFFRFFSFRRFSFGEERKFLSHVTE